MGVFWNVSLSLSANDAGKVNAVSELQLAKASLPSSSTVEGSFTPFNKVQPLKVLAFMMVIAQPSSNVMVSRAVHLLKAALPMVATAAGICMFFRAWHWAKALSPIWSTDAGMTQLVSDLQP